MRKAVFFICLAYTALFAFFLISTITDGSMDNMSRGMSLGFLMVGALVTALFAIPALILALMDKAPGWALGLALTPPILALILGGFG